MRSQLGASKLFVWIDPDQCTGAGLCVDQCPDLFVVLEDGIACLVGADGQPRTEEVGAAAVMPVPRGLVDEALAAALSCPGECIFLEDIDTGARAT
jgi:ferredoxin